MASSVNSAVTSNNFKTITYKRSKMQQMNNKNHLCFNLAGKQKYNNNNNNNSNNNNNTIIVAAGPRPVF